MAADLGEAGFSLGLASPAKRAAVAYPRYGMHSKRHGKSYWYGTE
jgi:hypothetical protein